MKTLATCLIAVSMLFSATVGAQESDNVTLALDAAKHWLTLTDSGQYAPSWEQASALFQAAIAKAQWEGAMQAARSPLGSVKSRKLKLATYTKTLPGAPDGDYVVIQYDSQFEHKASATETLTPMREKDGKWKVSGYFIK